MENYSNNYNLKRTLSKILEWPSIAISIRKTSNFNPNSFQLLTGTQTNQKESNFIYLLSYTKPSKPNTIPSLTVNRRFKHHDNIQKIISFTPNNVITASSNNSLYLYDITQKCSEISTKPSLTLRPYSSECTGVSIGVNTEKLLSSSADGEVNLWDLNVQTNIGMLEPIKSSHKHQGKVNDVSWNSKNEFLYCSCGNDKRILFYDTREEKKTIAINTPLPVHKIAFNKFNSNLFLSSNNKHIIDLWDLRNTKIKLHTFKYHSKDISAIKWSDTNESMFISTGLDGAMVVWNVQLLEERSSPVESEDRPFEAEVIYKQGSRIFDFDWRDNKVILVDIGNHADVFDLESKKNVFI